MMGKMFKKLGARICRRLPSPTSYHYSGSLCGRQFKCVRPTYLLLAIIAVICLTKIGHYSLDKKIGKGDISLSNNYLRAPNSSFHDGFLVDTGKCRIPNIAIRKDQLHRTKRPVQCKSVNGTINGLTFIRKQVLVINRTMLRTMDLKLTDIHCCYQTIERITQSLSDAYNRSVDSRFKISDLCHSMPSWKTSPISGYTKVTCKKRGYLGNYTHLHTDFHLMAFIDPDNPETKSNDAQNNNTTSGSTLQQKLQFWKDNADLPRPPSVLLLGIDSTSRNNFRRMLVATTKVLEELFGAVEMRGYNKVGDNTFPNLLPLMTSFSVDQVSKVCQKYRLKPFDDCPFLWKDFSNRNYLTSHIEDSTTGATFNYLNTGFVAQPVDIYPRPWMFATYKKQDYDKCVDSRRPDQILLRYTEELVELAHSRGIPYFISVFMTMLTHDDKTGLASMDVGLKEMLLRMRQMGNLDNTLLLVMGDHGYRWGKERLSRIGWYEEKLPALWITLPPSLKRKYPVWEGALRYNSRQLMTPFDVHQTIMHLLRTQIEEGAEVEKRQSSGIGVSLFENVPQRSCEEASIPPQFCTCASPIEFNSNPDIVQMAVDAAMSDLRARAPSKNCATLQLDVVTAFAAVQFASPSQETASNRGIMEGSTRLLIGILAVPGNLRVEALLGFNMTVGKFEVLDLFQTSRITGDRSCVPVNKTGLWCSCMS